MELLKSKEKEIVSGSNVSMPLGFKKPLDYSIDLLVRTHPTLRKYENQVLCADTDPEHLLYPLSRQRTDLRDEISLKNAKNEEDLTMIRSFSKTVSGAFVNELSISNQDIPGIFGIKVLETMPTNVREVYIQKRNNQTLRYRCDYRAEIVPDLLQKPD
jgi:hypothetical protein